MIKKDNLLFIFALTFALGAILIYIRDEIPSLEIRDGLAYKNGQLFTGKNVIYQGIIAKFSETNYFNGYMEGKYILWHPNGQKAGQVFYKKGKAEGVHDGWYDSGVKKFTAYYKNNKLDGRYIWWYKNKQRKYLINYKNGKKFGIEKKWDIDGNLIYSEFNKFTLDNSI